MFLCYESHVIPKYSEGRQGECNYDSHLIVTIKIEKRIKENKKNPRK